MKHSFDILLVIVSLFFVSQVVGLLVTKAYIDVPSSKEFGKVVWKALPALAGVPFERPDVNPNIFPVYVIVGVVFGTLLVWLLARVRRLFL